MIPAWTAAPAALRCAREQYGSRVRRFSFCALVAVLALACSTAQAAPHSLKQQGRWTVDSAGRTVITHGVNMVYKLPPYTPEAAGFNNADARFLAHHGFNSVRLGVIFAGLEPKPGRIDQGYLNQIIRTHAVLAQHGIYTLFDFHQDLYNEKFTGEGFPAWAVLDNGKPAEPLTGFPGTYLTSPGENASWDSLWSDAKGPGGVGLQERYASAWRHVAKTFSSSAYVMGYDPINEPWPGSIFATCLSPTGCPAFEQGPLAELEQKVTTAIRKADRRHMVWYEPVVTANSGTAYATVSPKGGNVGFNFHDYCLTGTADPPCGTEEQLTVDNAKARAKANGDPFLMSEFGATDDIPTIERMVDRSDAAMLSWQWWHYCGCSDPTTSGPGDTQALVRDPKKAPRGTNVFRTKLAALERPYPQAVAGTPKSYAYDRDSNEFTLSYATRSPSGKRLPRRVESVVYVPHLHYRHGYRVQVQGAKVTSKPGARHLHLRRARGAHQVTLTVAP